MSISTNAKKSFCKFLETGVHEPVDVAVTVVVPTDPFRDVLVMTLAMAMVAKELHYNAKGKAFFSLHEMADRMSYCAEHFDNLIEVRYLGTPGLVVPSIPKLYSDAAVMANSYLCDKSLDPVNDLIDATARICEAIVEKIERCKQEESMSSGESASLDEVARHVQKWGGLLRRALEEPLKDDADVVG